MNNCAQNYRSDRPKNPLPLFLVITVLFALLLAAAYLRAPGAGGFIEYPMLAKNDIPAAIAISKDDTVWFTLDFSDAVGVFRNGAIERLPKGKVSIEPIGLDTDSSGNAWYGDQAQRVISRMTALGEVRSFPVGTPIARFARLRVAPDDSVWFAESTSYSVTKLKDGMLARYTIPSVRGSPYGIALDHAGGVWATLQAANQILHIDNDGKLEWHWVPTPNSAPSDIAVDKDGAVWFLQFRTNTIGRLKGGEFTDFPVSRTGTGQGSGLAGLAVASDGTLWFGLLREHALGRLRNGTVTKFAIPRPNARPCGVAIDSKGNVWYVDISGFLGMLPAKIANRQ